MSLTVGDVVLGTGTADVSREAVAVARYNVTFGQIRAYLKTTVWDKFVKTTVYDDQDDHPERVVGKWDDALTNQMTLDDLTKRAGDGITVVLPGDMSLTATVLNLTYSVVASVPTSVDKNVLTLWETWGDSLNEVLTHQTNLKTAFVRDAFDTVRLTTDAYGTDYFDGWYSDGEVMAEFPTGEVVEQPSELLTAHRTRYRRQWQYKWGIKAYGANDNAGKMKVLPYAAWIDSHQNSSDNITSWTELPPIQQPTFADLYASITDLANSVATTSGIASSAFAVGYAIYKGDVLQPTAVLANSAGVVFNAPFMVWVPWQFPPMGTSLPELEGVISGVGTLKDLFDQGWSVRVFFRVDKDAGYPTNFAEWRDMILTMRSKDIGGISVAPRLGGRYATLPIAFLSVALKVEHKAGGQEFWGARHAVEGNSVVVFDPQTYNLRAERAAMATPITHSFILDEVV